MARPNDTASLGRTSRNQNEQENRRSSIFIDGEENEEQHMVTLDKFLQYASEKPEWLFEKLRLIHRRYDECLDDREAQLAEEELHGKAKDGEITVLRCEVEEIKRQLQNQTDNEDVKQQLIEARAECDAFGSHIA